MRSSCRVATAVPATGDEGASVGVGVGVGARAAGEGVAVAAVASRKPAHSGWFRGSVGAGACARRAAADEGPAAAAAAAAGNGQWAMGKGAGTSRGADAQQQCSATGNGVEAGVSCAGGSSSQKHHGQLELLEVPKRGGACLNASSPRDQAC